MNPNKVTCMHYKCMILNFYHSIVYDTVQILCKMLENFSYLKANVKLLYKH